MTKVFFVEGSQGQGKIFNIKHAVQTTRFLFLFICVEMGVFLVLRDERKEKRLIDRQKKA